DVLTVDLARRLDGFALNVRWQAAEPVIALVGASGSGKTLTLQCLAGLVRPDAGRVVLDGAVLFDGTAGIDRPPAGHRVEYVSHGHALVPQRSVRDTIAGGLDDERASRAIEGCALGGLEGRRVGDLSAGQRQRVALARALAADRDLLLLDDPLA